MNTLNKLSLLLLAFLFANCSTTDPNTNTSGRSLLEVHTVLDSTQQVFLASAKTMKGNVGAALRQTVDWLLKQSNIADAYSFDDRYISITLKSGLTTEFYIDETDDAGNSLFRGGGSIDKMLDAPPLEWNTDNSILSKNKITNKKVLLFAADATTLPAVAPQIARTVSRLSGSGIGLDITVLKNEQCSYGVVEHFGDYGLVIMDTHGQKDGFLVGTILDFSRVKTESDVTAQVNAQAGAGAADKVTSGKLALAAKIHLNIKKPLWYESVIPTANRGLIFRASYLDLLPKMPNTVIFGNMCYSGWTASTVVVPPSIDTNADGSLYNYPGRTVTISNPIGQAFINREPISYYGYARDNPPGTSRVVYDNFAAEMEDSLVKRLVDYKDSTKIIHFKPDNISEYHDYPYVVSGKTIDLVLRHFGKDDYSFQECVPFVDSRDGEKYCSVKIGDQTWMAENLRYNAAGSLCYNSDPTNCTVYGRYYDYATMMQGAAPSTANPSGVKGVCPNGWHLPSMLEYKQLVDFLGGTFVAGGKMKSVSTLWDTTSGNNLGASNSSGFNALPSGWVRENQGTKYFEAAGINVSYFTTDQQTIAQPNDAATNVLIYISSQNVTFGSNFKTTGYPCRCLKD